MSVCTNRRANQQSAIFCRRRLPLASIRWVRFGIIKPLCTVPSSTVNKSRQHQGLLGEKQVCYHCSMHIPTLRYLKPIYSTSQFYLGFGNDMNKFRTCPNRPHHALEASSFQCKFQIRITLYLQTIIHYKKNRSKLVDHV